MNKSNWDDIRYVLAVAETGSLNAAASRLSVTHATVLRRVGSFEARHGQAVFQKLATGYRVLPEAEPVLLAARNVQDAVLAVDRAFLGADQSLAGEVRIASTDSLSTLVLPGIIQAISARYPALKLTLLSTNIRQDFFRLSADIAVRPAVALEKGMSGRVAASFEFAQYSVDPSDDFWIGLDGPLTNSRAAAWMVENVPPDRIRQSADSFLVVRELAAAGAGKALLPTFVGDPDPRLKRQADAVPSISVPIWVATLEELERNARFRAVRDALGEGISRSMQRFQEASGNR
ncbi:LysR family transcriptional regulator [Tropicimonas sp. IMCC6043]|uniref:LysR family transcriptional regulator n=1 Tax=Tropicimonas sp. IMCC6043 TaxID=2510645 RepID=UPI00101DCE59|nr:LysR family transcriptional regulator [Tropicimonas sp. IMCC6043]RYH06733.1 LysR family transcriptional regulator [Tropicimonas sp. IMCC6043]